MAKIKRSFARSDRTIGNNSRVGATINPSAATAPGRALAQGSKEAGNAVSSAIQKQAKRDTAIIVADRASKAAELTARDINEAQMSSKSNLDDPNFSGAIQDLDVIVNTPTGGDNNGKAYTDYVLARFDERAKEALDGVSGMAKAGVQAELNTQRQQLLRDSLSFESRETRRVRRNHARDVVDRNGQVVFDNPLLFDSVLQKQNHMIDEAQIGQGDQKNTKGALSNNLAANAMRGLIKLSPDTAISALQDKNSSIRKHLTGEQISTFETKAQTAKDNVDEATKESVQGLYDQSIESLKANGTEAPGIQNMIRDTFEGEEAVEKLATLKATKVIAPTLEKMKNSNIDEAIKLRDDVLKNGKFKSSVAKAKAGEIMKAEVNKHISRLQTDPALAVRENNAEQFDDIPQDDLLTRYRATLRHQKLIGVGDSKTGKISKQRGLTNAERDTFVHSINNSQPDQLLQLVGGLRDQMRTPLGEVDHSFRFFKEILDKEDGLDPMHYMFVHNAELPVSQDIISALEFAKSKQAKDLKKDENRDTFIGEIRSKINKGLQSWSQQSVGPQEEWNRTVDQVRESAVQLTEYYMSELGLPAQQAVNRSINGLVGDHVIDNARKSRVVKNQLFNGLEGTTESGDKAILLNGQWMTKKDGAWVPIKE